MSLPFAISNAIISSAMSRSATGNTAGNAVTSANIAVNYSTTEVSDGKY